MAWSSGDGSRAVQAPRSVRQVGRLKVASSVSSSATGTVLAPDFLSALVTCPRLQDPMGTGRQ